MNPKPRTAIADRARIVFGTLICKTVPFSFDFSEKSLLFDIIVKPLAKLRSFLSLGENEMKLLCCKVNIFHFPGMREILRHGDKGNVVL